MENAIPFILCYILSIIVSVSMFIYVNYDEGHDLDICVLGQMVALGSIPILNILIAISIFVENLNVNLDFDCSKIVILKGKNRD